MTATTTARTCRGWPLVRAAARLSPAERVAAEGQLALCRHCAARVEAEKSLEQRLAAAGSTTLGFGVAALVARLVGGSSGVASLTGSSVAPVVALSTVAVLTASVGGAVAVTRDAHPVAHHRVVTTVPAAPGRGGPGRTSTGSGAVTGAGAGVAPTSPAPAPATTGHPTAAPATAAPRIVAPTTAGHVATTPLPLPTSVTVPTLPALPPVPTPSLPLPAPSIPVLPSLPLPLPLPAGGLVPTVTSLGAG